jgi:hypothetical protein
MNVPFQLPVPEYAERLANTLRNWTRYVDEIHPFDVYHHPFDLWDDWIRSMNTSEFMEILLATPSQKEYWKFFPENVQLLLKHCEELRLPNIHCSTERAVGMSQKKWHEIQILKSILHDMAGPQDVIVDFGSGLGYLANAVAEKNPVIAIECDQYRAHKSKEMCSERVVHLCKRLDSNNALSVIEEASKGIPYDHFIITSLHGCGDLSAKVMLDVFETTHEIRGIVAVGCCYHWIDLQEFPRSSVVKSLKFPFTRRLLKVSQNDFVDKMNRLSLWKKQTIRAIIQQKGRINVKDGDLFPQVLHYIRKFSVDMEITEAEVDFVFKKVAFLSVIRCLIGPLVEALILTDRYCYLSERFSNVQLVPIFDATISPRNHALICKK